MDAAITPSDRLSFTLFLALALHAALILGLGFVWTAQTMSSPTIEVTLAQHHDPEAPEKADFIAQADQLGSGDASEIKETTTTRSADFTSAEVREVAAHDLPPLAATERTVSEATLLTTVAAAEQQANTETPTPEILVDTAHTPYQRYLDLAKEIASLEAQIENQYQLEAHGPRVRRLTSVSAKRTADAYYLQSWRRKVEAVGNLNYPAAARRDQLYGSLRLLVAITPDGDLMEVRVLDSSGYAILDDAAVRIVQLAAPFAPFPPEMRKDTDVLEIIRTWQFRRNHYTSSS
jgi:protein TonB